MKKILPIFLTLILIVSVFSGCSNTTDDISDKLIGYTWVYEDSREDEYGTITTVETLVFHENGTASRQWKVSAIYSDGRTRAEPPINSEITWTVSEEGTLTLRYSLGSDPINCHLSSNGTLLDVDNDIYVRQ